MSLRQLRRIGIDRRAVERAAANGLLVRVHRAVYSIGPPRATLAARAWAAVLAVGAHALVCGRSAAALAGTLPELAGPIHVLVVGPAVPRGRPGIRIRRAAVPLGPVHRTGGPPRTGPVWTLHDLATVVGARDLREAVWRSIARGGIEAATLRRSIDHHAGRRGNERLRAAVDAVADPSLPRTREELEPRMLLLCRHAGLPAPVVGAPVDRFVVDFLWEEQRLIVETDGGTHERRDRRASDRRRDWRLTELGYTVLRMGWDDVVHAPGLVADTLRPRLLATGACG